MIIKDLTTPQMRRYITLCNPVVKNESISKYNN